jgi:hypothetical protein
MVACGMHA